MLLRIYFLSFLLHNIIFCYEYKVGNYDLEHVNGRFKSSEVNKLQSQKHQLPESNVEEPVAQLDLASFIQSPDDQLENSQTFEESKSKSGSDDYESLDSIERMLHKNMESLQYSDDVELNNALGVGNVDVQNRNMKDRERGDNKLQNKKHDNTEENMFRQASKKKRVFKSMKLPFLSSKTNNSAKTKKSRKRRLFGFHINKKHTTTASTTLKFTATKVSKIGAVTDPQKMYKLKRSYFESLCPSCRRRYVIANKYNDDENKVDRSSKLDKDVEYGTYFYDMHKVNEEE